MRIYFTVIVLGLALFGALSWAGAPNLEGVQISYEGQTLRVEVTQPTSLRAVLEQLCQQTQADCELELEEGTAVVPAVTVRGSWQEVVAELFEGTNLNYASLAPSPGQGARLMVLNRPAAVEGALATGRSRGGREQRSIDRSDVGSAAGESPPYPVPRGEGEDGTTGASDGDALDVDGAAAESPRESGTEAEPAWQQPDSSTGAIGGPAGAAREDRGSSASEDAASPYHLPPFMGGPALPPIAEPPGLPFPDENGNPIPLSNQPLTGLPFPDENGNPIAIVPLQPGQQAGSPFPPDTPTSSSPSKARGSVSGVGMSTDTSPPDK